MYILGVGDEGLGYLCWALDCSQGREILFDGAAALAVPMRQRDSIE